MNTYAIDEVGKDPCQHEEREWSDEYWARGERTGYSVLTCKICGHGIERKPKQEDIPTLIGQLLQVTVEDRGDWRAFPKYILSIAKLDGTPLPNDEPLFILRGQDKLAGETVRFYAGLCLIHGRDRQEILPILEHANALEEWPIKKLPD